MILIFDASIEGFSAGIFSPAGALISHIENNTPYSHTELLVPTLQDVLSSANIEFKDLTKIITTKGPGSFTGIRVGLATAAGLGAALNIPVVAVNTLLALSQSALHHHHPNPMSKIHAVLDTKCGEVYHQTFTYSHGNVLIETAPSSIGLEELIIIADHDVVITHPSSKPALADISCVTVPLTLEGVWNAAQQAEDNDLQPLYVRSANINPPKLNA